MKDAKFYELQARNNSKHQKSDPWAAQLVDVCTLSEQQEHALEDNPRTASRGTTIAREIRYDEAVVLAAKVDDQLQVVFYQPSTRVVVESH